MVEVKQVFDVGGLRQHDLSRKRMFGEKRNQLPRISGQRIEGKAVLQLAVIECRRFADFASRFIDFVHDVVDVREYFDRRGKPGTRSAGQIAIGTTEGTKSVQREMPIIGTDVPFFAAQTHGTAMFANDKSSLSGKVLVVGRCSVDGNLRVRDMRKIFWRDIRVQGQDFPDQIPSGVRSIPPASQNDP